MKLEKLVGERFKERPADCVIDSHAIMVKGGYIKYMANGIYSSYLPLRRIVRKIEQILREEMDKIDGQEVQFPVVMPASLWDESGRYDSIGDELLRFTDRNNAKMVLGMTHEEAAVHLVREYAQSYTKYPFMIYQIQTKFRDEARPRAGLIRVREFTMKDAYSFHTSQEDLEQYYEKCHAAYERIFERVGVPEVVSVKSDSGMMGGNISHEFMLLTPVGEDSIVLCDSCDYRANMEAAENISDIARDAESAALEKVYTPNVHTIEDVCNFFGDETKNSCKAVVYQQNVDDKYVVLFIRGDLEVNETKLVNFLGEQVHAAVITEECGLNAGYIGPVDLKVNGDAVVLYDKSLEGRNNLSCGANEAEHHYKGLDMERDVPNAEYHDFAKIQEGGICPKCGKKTVKISRGIEVGNIFQLGTKYTKSMNMQYLDADGESHYPIMGCYGIGVGRLAASVYANGESKTPIMGCYGIGVGRLAASVCEAHHDEYGPIWPKAIAPWQVHLCAVRVDDEEVRAYADKLYEDLQNAGIEVIYDDRSVRAGVMFADADLLGIPLRIIVSPKNMKQGVVEVASRDKTLKTQIPLENVMEEIKQYL